MQKQLKSIAACITLIIFLSQTLSPLQAFGAQTFSPSEVKTVSPFQLNIPSDLGSIENLSSGPGPTLIHIQTAHGNYEAQKKIQSILELLNKQYGFKWLFLEGSAFKLDPDRLKFFPDEMDLTLKIADDLTREALVKGAELFLLQNQETKAYGIEELKTYVDNGRAFKAVLVEQKKTKQFVEEMNMQIERLTSPYLNKDLRAFLARLEAFENQTIPVTDWLAALKNEALKNLETDLSDPAFQIDWPMLVRLFKMHEFEAKIDRHVYPKEREQFLEAIRHVVPKNSSVYEQVEKFLNGDLTQNELPDPETGRLFEALAAALPPRFDYSAYPNVKNFVGHLILQSEVKADRLAQEIEQLQKQISEKLAGTPQEKKILALLNDQRLLKKLFSLELTPSEYEALLKRKEDLRPGLATRRFLEIDREHRVRNAKFQHLEEMDSLYTKALEFYRLAKKRDQIMMDNISRRFKETGAEKAIVITGGFHAQPFKEFFSGQGYNYALIAPKINSIHPKDREVYIRSVFDKGLNFSASTWEQPFVTDNHKQMSEREIFRFGSKIVQVLGEKGLRFKKGSVEVRPYDEDPGYQLVSHLFGKQVLVPVKEGKKVEIIKIKTPVWTTDASRKPRMLASARAELRPSSNEPGQKTFRTGRSELRTVTKMSEAEANYYSHFAQAVTNLDLQQAEDIAILRSFQSLLIGIPREYLYGPDPVTGIPRDLTPVIEKIAKMEKDRDIYQAFKDLFGYKDGESGPVFRAPELLRLFSSQEDIFNFRSTGLDVKLEIHSRLSRKMASILNPAIEKIFHLRKNSRQYSAALRDIEDISWMGFSGLALQRLNENLQKPGLTKPQKSRIKQAILRVEKIEQDTGRADWPFGSRQELRSLEDLKNEAIQILQRALPFTAEVDRKVKTAIENIRQNKFADANLSVAEVIEHVTNKPHSFETDSPYVTRLWSAYALIKKAFDLEAKRGKRAELRSAPVSDEELRRRARGKLDNLFTAAVVAYATPNAKPAKLIDKKYPNSLEVLLEEFRALLDLARSEKDPLAVQILAVVEALLNEAERKVQKQEKVESIKALFGRTQNQGLFDAIEKLHLNQNLLPSKDGKWKFVEVVRVGDEWTVIAKDGQALVRINETKRGTVLMIGQEQRMEIVKPSSAASIRRWFDETSFPVSLSAQSVPQNLLFESAVKEQGVLSFTPRYAKSVETTLGTFDLILDDSKAMANSFANFFEALIASTNIPQNVPVGLLAWNYKNETLMDKLRKDFETSLQNASGQDKVFLEQLKAAFEDTLAQLDKKIKNGQINPGIQLRISPDQNVVDRALMPQALLLSTRPLRVGVLGATANPLVWGHLLIALLSMNQLNLDTVIFPIPGPVTYKQVPKEQEMPVETRHKMAQAALKDFYPLLRYSGVAKENSKTEETIHLLRQLNPGQKIDFVFLAAGEAEERTRRIMRDLKQYASKYRLEENPRHTLTWGIIERGEFGRKLDETTFDQMKQQEKFNFPTVMIRMPYQGLDEMSSTAYRNSLNPKYVQPVIHKLYSEWASKNKPKDRSELRAEGELPFEFDAKNMIIQPLKTLAQANAAQQNQLVKNIFVYAYDEKPLLPPKLGEQIIDTFPAIMALRRNFPESTIYLASHFPDIFSANEFQGKVIPIGKDVIDVFRSGITKSADLKARILAERKIDLVMDLSVSPYHFDGVYGQDFAASRPPFIIKAQSPVSGASAFAHTYITYQPKTGLVFQDREGKRFEISNETAPVNKVWDWALSTFNALGLDVNKENLGTVHLNVEESMAAFALLKKWYYKRNPDGYFDPKKKIFVINIYAVTQQDVLTENEWVNLIVALLNGINNAYFVFTAGGPMDPDEQLLKRVLEKVQEHPVLIDKKKSMSVVLDREAIYPLINDILGVASGVVTPDTGFSHLSFVFGVPTAVITKQEVLGWMPPSATAASFIPKWTDYSNRQILNPRFEAEIVKHMQKLNAEPDTPEVKAAKAVAASTKGRAKIDAALIKNRLIFPHAEMDLKDELARILRALGAPPELIPEIAFVDSAAQLGIDVPLFNTKLYTSLSGAKKTKTYLLIDKSVLQGESGNETVKEDIKGFDVFHEILGHRLARYISKKYDNANRTALLLAGNEDRADILRIKAEEEVFSWVLTFLSLSRSQNYFRLKDGVLEKMERTGVHVSDQVLSSAKLSGLISNIIDYLLDKNDELSVLRYRDILKTDREQIAQNVNDSYLETVLEIFHPGFDASRSEVRQELRMNAVPEASASGRSEVRQELRMNAVPEASASGRSEVRSESNDSDTAKRLEASSFEGRQELRTQTFNAVAFDQWTPGPEKLFSSQKWENPKATKALPSTGIVLPLQALKKLTDKNNPLIVYLGSGDDYALFNLTESGLQVKIGKTGREQIERSAVVEKGAVSIGRLPLKSNFAPEFKDLPFGVELKSDGVSVSRNHLWAFYAPGNSLVLKDLKSTAGSYLENDQLQMMKQQQPSVKISKTFKSIPVSQWIPDAAVPFSAKKNVDAQSGILLPPAGLLFTLQELKNFKGGLIVYFASREDFMTLKPGVTGIEVKIWKAGKEKPERETILESGGLAIGRNPLKTSLSDDLPELRSLPFDHDLKVEGNVVSRNQAWVFYNPGESLVIKDLKSASGTFVDKTQIQLIKKGGSIGSTRSTLITPLVIEALEVRKSNFINDKNGTSLLKSITFRWNDKSVKEYREVRIAMRPGLTLEHLPERALDHEEEFLYDIFINDKKVGEAVIPVVQEEPGHPIVFHRSGQDEISPIQGSPMLQLVLLHWVKNLKGQEFTSANSILQPQVILKAEKLATAMREIIQKFGHELYNGFLDHAGPLLRNLQFNLESARKNEKKDMLGESAASAEEFLKDIAMEYGEKFPEIKTIITRSELRRETDVPRTAKQFETGRSELRTAERLAGLIRSIEMRAPEGELRQEAASLADLLINFPIRILMPSGRPFSGTCGLQAIFWIGGTVGIGCNSSILILAMIIIR